MLTSSLTVLLPASSLRAGSGDVCRLLLTAKPTALLELLYPCMPEMLPLECLCGAGRAKAKMRAPASSEVGPRLQYWNHSQAPLWL